MYGSTIGGLLAPPTGPDQFGPRVESLTITTSTNIATLPRAYGTVAHKGNLIWAKDNEYIEVATTKKVRTGLFSKTKVTTYTYFFTGAFGFCRTEISAVLKIWHAGGRDLVYSATSTDTDTQVASGELTKYITIYKGTADQGIDPLIAEDVGEASCSAYRGVFYIVYNMYPLENYQNNVGNLDPKVEYTTKDVDASDIEWVCNIPAESLGIGQDAHARLHNATNHNAEGMHLWRFGILSASGIATDFGHYHYIARADGSLNLADEFGPPIVIGSPIKGYSGAAHGKSDRNVFISYVAGKVESSAGDGDFDSDPALLIPGGWFVQLIGAWGGAPTLIPVANMEAGIAYVLTRNGPGSAGTEAYMFTLAEQVEYNTGTDFGVYWRDSGGGLSRYVIYCDNPDAVPPLPITEVEYDTSYRVELTVNIVDIDDDKYRAFQIPLSGESMPNTEMHYSFYKDHLYFAYSYTGLVNLEKRTKAALDADVTERAGLALSGMLLKKIGILNDLLYVVSLNAGGLTQIHVLNLDLEEVGYLDDFDVLTEFGENDAEFAANFSPDFDKLFYVRDGHVFKRDSFDGPETDLGEASELIPGIEAPGLFNIHGHGTMLGVSTKGDPMPEVGVQFFTFGVVSEPGKIPLADIIIAENALVGITEDDLDVTTIDQMVRGYVVSEISPVRNVLQQLQAIFPWDVIQSGYKNKYVKRGLASVVTVPWQDLGPGISLAQDREMETQLPSKVEITFNNIALDYMPDIQRAERRLDIENIRRLNIPLVMNASEAAQAAEILLNIYHIERRTFVFTLPPTYRNLEPSDVITLAMKEVSYIVRLTNIHYLANGTMECQAKQHSDTVYVSTNPGATGSYTPPTTIPSIANPILGVLDIPVINDVQNKPGYTALVSHPSDGWVGGSVFRARDGVTYEMVQAFNTITVWGTCLDALAVHGGHLLDLGGSITVRPLKGIMADFTEAQMLNEESMLAYGKPGRWELICYQNAADNGNGTFTLNTFTRGRRGTEWASGLHQAGDYFAFVNDGTAKFISALATDIGLTLKHKAITTGRDLDSSSVVNLPYSAENLTPLSPVQAEGYRDSSDDFFGRFIPRTRLDSGYSMLEQIYDGAPIGEAIEAYEIDVLDGATVVRTIAVSAPEFEYPAADQVTDFGSEQSSIDFKIYQISATVGRGHVGAFTL
ncbi:MAG: phage tail protein [Pseudomonadota bacterium]